MKDYISLAACKGLRPVPTNRHLHPRPHLITRLLADRSRVRVVCGPAGMGKTSLSLEYAETMFGFAGVFWLDATSPCFIRDLDAGTLAAQILEEDGAAKLAVMEDVPALSPQRASALGEVAGRLLERGCEVLLTCTPSARAALAPAFPEVTVAPTSLLLSDNELAEYLQVAGLDVPDEARRRLLRLPACSWGSAEESGAREAMLDGLAHENLKPRRFGLLACALLLGRASEEAFCQVVKEAKTDGGAEEDPSRVLVELAKLASLYPFVVHDGNAGMLLTPEFSPKGILRAFRSRLEDAASALGYAGGNELLAGVATALLASGDGPRACEVAGTITQSTARAAWLDAVQKTLLDRMWLMEACELYGGLGTGFGRSQVAFRLRFGQAIRLGLLGFDGAVSEEARIIRESLNATSSIKLGAAVAEAYFAGDTSAPEAFSRLRDERARLSAVPAGPRVPGKAGERAAKSGEAQSDGLALARNLADALVCLEQPGLPAELLAVHERIRGGIKPGIAGVATAFAGVVSGYWIARRVSAMEPALRDIRQPGLDEVRTFLATFLQARRGKLYTPDARLTLCGYLAARALQLFAEAGLPHVALPSALEAAYQRTSAHLAVQLRRAKERFAACAPSPGGSVISFPARAATSSQDADALRGVPMLDIRLFGSLEVRRGGVLLSNEDLSRQKVKVFLALLALNAGQELPRELVAEELWPQSFLDVATRSFYSVWSKLRRALSDETGACPYLQRMQNGYRMEARLVRTDAARLEELCRVFLLGRVDARRWLELLEEFEDVCRGDLLPTESDSRAIVAARARFRRKAADALLAASARLLQSGENAAALLFAYAAAQRERQREDVYLALMRAQIAADQRTSAVETYLACKEMLAEGPGLEPSPKMEQLYLSIVRAAG